jgi:hypothetical protein
VAECVVEAYSSPERLSYIIELFKELGDKLEGVEFLEIQDFSLNPARYIMPVRVMYAAEEAAEISK